MVGILGFKVALCWAYLRMLKASPNPHYKTLIYLVMGGVVVGHVAGTFVLLFQCSPVRKSWRPRTPGNCLPNDATFYGLATVTIIFDVIIFILPVPLLMKLSINMKKKIVLCGVFLLGLLTTVCSVMRMLQILTIAKTGNSTMLVLWGVIELNVGVSTFGAVSGGQVTDALQITLTCIPTLGPLFPRLTGSTPTAPSQNHNHRLGDLRKKGISKGVKTGISPPFDAHGAYRPDLGGTMANNSDNSSQEGIMAMTIDEAIAYAMREDDIVKTTDIRVSIEDSERAASRAQSARAW
ncbi:MAG: hypothetical protein Q9179_000351 [Wetmoreana sp. 5 TL-2023]